LIAPPSKLRGFLLVFQATLFLITPNLTILAIGFATALGAGAGVLPAWRAARLDTVIEPRDRKESPEGRAGL